ncbi:LEA-2 domain-containing protein [Mycena kentingensis (nom. inval.)]|nr:LEA-2 domain-containing protein [Mycena kentingensis (nom. inval.)]
MSYNDPYAGRYGGQQQQYDSYGQPQQPNYGGGGGYGQYNDADSFNPYVGSQQQQHPTYDQGGYDNYGGGYRDEPPQQPPQQPQQQYQDPPQRQGSGHSYADHPPPPLNQQKNLAETSSFDPGEFTPRPRGPKTASNRREYRKDFQGNLWTKGGRGRCCFRFFCCTFLSIVFLLLVALLSLVLWLRPPSIDFGDVAPSAASGSTIQTTTNGITLHMGVNISVQNPNYFAVKFKKITANIFYPTDGVNDTEVGGGTATNIMLDANKETNFTFPFTIDYSTTKDPSSKILLDLATKCGVLGGSKQQLTVHYKIKLELQFLIIPLSPTISNDFKFTCPLEASDLEGLLSGAGIGSLGSS